MPNLPDLLSTWFTAVAWRDLLFALAALVLVTLLVIWWSQQTRYWYRITICTFLAAFLFCMMGFYLFEVPPYYASCPAGCPGWRGYPRPVATILLDGSSQISGTDFGLNLLMLWLLWLAASMIWRLLGIAFQWWQRPLRGAGAFHLLRRNFTLGAFAACPGSPAAATGGRRFAPGQQCAPAGRIYLPDYGGVGVTSGARRCTARCPAAWRRCRQQRDRPPGLFARLHLLLRALAALPSGP